MKFSSRIIFCCFTLGVLVKKNYVHVYASTDELNPLVWTSFIPTAYHARNDTEYV